MRITTPEMIKVDHEKLAEKISEGTFLSKREAEVFVLRKAGRLDVEEVAEELDISEGTVSSYSERYREKIKKAEKLTGINTTYSKDWWR